jgi:hypothetical protein
MADAGLSKPDRNKVVARSHEKSPEMTAECSGWFEGRARKCGRRSLDASFQINITHFFEPVKILETKGRRKHATKKWWI